jgi:hypothetical protein
VVLFLGHQQGLMNQVGQRGRTGSPWVAKDYFHAIGRRRKGHVTDGQLVEVISAHTWRSMSFVIPFLALDSLLSSAGS